MKMYYLLRIVFNNPLFSNAQIHLSNLPARPHLYAVFLCVFDDAGHGGSSEGLPTRDASAASSSDLVGRLLSHAFGAPADRWTRFA